MKWNAFPFLRISCSFICGICGAKLFPYYNNSLLFVLSAIIVVYSIVRILIKGKYYYDYNFIIGILALLFMFISGYYWLEIRNPVNNNNHLVHVSKQILYYEAIISTQSQEKEKYLKNEADVIQVFDGKKWHPVSGTILLYISKKTHIQTFKYGDRILVKGHPQIVNAPSNPDDFDFRKYLNSRNIYHQHFISPEKILFIVNDPINPFISASLKAREYFHYILKRYIKEKDELSVAGALLLGITSDLEQDLRQSYIAAGTMHILAVSGLHVGIIYWIVLLVFGKIKKKKYGRFFYAAASLLVLWAYAFITGLSPSVMRAVIMFSFIVIAEASYRRTNIYNTIAASAFIILIIDPFMLFAVGFQLSYLALLGIIYLQKKIYNLWEVHNYLGNYAWQISSVSIAAQIAVFPLSFFYFNQFPVYFLISNLFAIFGASLMLTQGVALLIIGELDFLGKLIGYTLEHTIFIINFLVRMVEQLPHSQLKEVEITGLQTICLYAAIISILALLKTRRFKFSILTTFFFITFSFLHFVTIYQTSNTNKMIVYSKKGETKIDFIDGFRKSFYTGINVNDSKKEQNNQAVIFSSTKNKTINETKEYRRINNFLLFIWHQNRIVLIDKPFSGLHWNKKFSVDYIILSNNAIDNLDDVTSRFSYKKIIVDNSNNSSVVYSLKKQVTIDGQEVYFTTEKGAFVDIQNKID